MPATLTVGQVAVAIRAATDPDMVPPAIAAILDCLVPAGKALVEGYAPGAPDAVLDAALIRVVGWLFDADPAETRTRNPMQVSGATAILSSWHIQRAGLVMGDTAPAVVVPTPPAGGGNVPDPPGDGNFILTSDNGEFVWVMFPKP